MCRVPDDLLIISHLVEFVKRFLKSFLKKFSSFFRSPPWGAALLATGDIIAYLDAFVNRFLKKS